MSEDRTELDQLPAPTRPGADTGRRAGRTWLHRVAAVVAWLVGIALWVVVCFTWLFPWLTENGFDPTLEG